MTAHIQTNSHTVAVLLDDRSGPIRVLQSGGADVHSGGTGLKGRVQRSVIAHAAGQFDVHAVAKLMNDFTQLIAIVARTESGIKIDQVNPFGTGLNPGTGGLKRRTVIGFGTGFALAQAHGLAIAYIDGGQQSQRHKKSLSSVTYTQFELPRQRELHAFYSVAIQFLRSWEPASPDFSGWNCVADSGPCS